MEHRNLILAVLLSILILWVYINFFTFPLNSTKLNKNQNDSSNIIVNKNDLSDITSSIDPSLNIQTCEQIFVETPLLKCIFNERGGCLEKIVLKKFTMEAGGKGGEYIMINSKKGDPLSLSLNLPKIDPLISQKRFTANLSKLTINEKDIPQTLTFTIQLGDLKLVKAYTFTPDSYIFELKISYTNLSNHPMELISELSLYDYAAKSKINTSAFTGMLGYRDQKLIDEDLGSVNDKKNIEKVETGCLSWVGLSIPYFMSAIVINDNNNIFKRSLRAGLKRGIMNVTLIEPLINIENGDTQTQLFLIFYGPRDLNLLNKIGYNLDAAVNFGWFDFLAKPMLAALNFFFHLTGKNYGVAIIIITILIKIILWPISSKSYNAMKKMQKLQPLIINLREKYKNDRAQLQQEIVQLYKVYKVNPLGGCLPMLVQFPVFIAFYKVLGSAIELRHAFFMLWINDLSVPDRLPIGFNFIIPFVQEGYGVPVLTLLMGVSMFIQQRMTPNSGDPTQAKLMFLMPILFIFMFLNFSSGLVLYWLVQGILSIGQQWWINQQRKFEFKQKLEC